MKSVGTDRKYAAGAQDATDSLTSVDFASDAIHSLPYVHLARANSPCIVDRDSARAIEEYRAALEKEPNNTIFLSECAAFLMNQWEAAEAGEQFRRAFHLKSTADPDWRVAASLFLLQEV